MQGHLPVLVCVLLAQVVYYGEEERHPQLQEMLEGHSKGKVRHE